MQELVSHLAVERLDIAVLPGVARIDEQRLHLKFVEPNPAAVGSQTPAHNANVSGPALLEHSAIPPGTPAHLHDPVVFPLARLGINECTH